MKEQEHRTILMGLRRYLKKTIQSKLRIKMRVDSDQPYAIVPQLRIRTQHLDVWTNVMINDGKIVVITIDPINYEGLLNYYFPLADPKCFNKVAERVNYLLNNNFSRIENG